MPKQPQERYEGCLRKVSFDVGDSWPRIQVRMLLPEMKVPLEKCQPIAKRPHEKALPGAKHEL
jgi:hypothetical protein